MFFLFAALALLCLVLAQPAAHADITYRFERMWPTLPQPWYFRGPQGVAVDSAGSVYVADTGNSRIQKFTSDGAFVTKWGGPDLAIDDGGFASPEAVAVDKSGNLYVSDTSQVFCSIHKRTSEGTLIAKWGSWGEGDGQFNEPSAIAVDGAGNVYVADSYTCRIQKFTSSGGFLKKWGSRGAGDGQFGDRVDMPSYYGQRGVAIDSSDNVYVLDTYNHRIQKFSSEGEFIAKWGSLGSGEGQFNEPRAVIVDETDKVYVADPLNNRIQEFSSNGVFISSWIGMVAYRMAVDHGGSIYALAGDDRIRKSGSDGAFLAQWGCLGTGNGQFNSPRGAGLDGLGDLYVADAENNRIQKFSSTGAFVLTWGAYGTGDGQFYIPSGVAVDGFGNVYVADYLNERIQKFDCSGVFVTKWGGEGWRDGQFYGPRAIAVDGSNSIYVADASNHRIQKFTSDGVFVMKWGSWGAGDGQFKYPNGVAVDSSGNVYVTDQDNLRVQKFDSNGTFAAKWASDYTGGVAVDGMGNVYVVNSRDSRIQEFTSGGVFVTAWGGTGTDEAQFSNPLGVAADATGHIYLADTYNHRIQKFSPVTLTSNTKAIVVAGGGPFSGNELWDATQASANFAYRVLTYQGFTKETICYLSSNLTLDLDNDGVSNVSDPVADGVFTKADLEYALTQWVPERTGGLPTGDVVVYLVDHGGTGTFRLSGTETVTASELAGWINTMQSNPNVTGRVTVVYDACESGTFHAALAAPNRTVITSTSPGEQAYFLDTGTVSFSSFFWSQVFNGEDLRTAFDFATTAVGQTLSVQNPQVNANGNYTPNEAVGDLDALVGVHIGSGTDLFQGRPTIGSVSAPQTISGSTATLSATNVTDPQGDRIVRVWAVIRPPDYVPTDPNNPIQNMPSIDFNRVGESNDFSADYSQFTSTGTYYIAIYSMDQNLNVSTPSQTSVTVNSPRKKRAVIVAGGTAYDTQWSAYERCYKEAYDALRKQGYADTELYVMAQTTVIPATVHLPSLSNLQYALGTWAGSDTQDLALYMVGPGGNDLFQISTSQTLDGATLNGWLNTLETHLTGRVVLVYDACNAGTFLPLMAKTGRILISSTRPTESARFLKDGNVSFSKFFWGRVLNGANVERCFLDAKAAMQFGGGGQLAQLDDNGNGVPNEAGDGQVARYHLLGTGITTAGDAPLIGSAIGNQALSGSTSVTLWADQVTTTGSIQSVWAAITPPGYTTGECAPLVPLVELTTGGTHQYEGTYSGFTKAGAYSVSLYAMDTSGSISAPKECVITQPTASDTTPPVVAGLSPANGDVGVALRPVIRFHLTDAGSGVDRNTIVMAVNGVDVSGQLLVTGLPSDYAVSYTPLVAFGYSSAVRVTVNASDVDRNALGAQTYTFTTTSATDSNGDGMPDDWTVYYGLFSPAADADGDGFTNAQEAAMGTDPLAPNVPTSAPDQYEEDDTYTQATWFRLGGVKQRHTFHDMGDQDWFAFHANAGAILTIETSSLGPDADTYLRLYGSDGTTLKAEDDNGGGGGASLIHWTVPAGGSGIYYVQATNTPASKYGAGAYYDFQARRDSGGPDIKADAGADLTKSLADAVTLDGSGSSDESDFTKKPKWYQWTFVSKPSGSAATLTNATTDHAGFTADRVGVFILQLQVGDGTTPGTGNTSLAQVIVTAVDPADAKTVWVDFGFTGIEDGSQTRPYRLLTNGVSNAPTTGLVKLKWNSTKPTTNEKPRITKALKVVSVGGPVRVGVLTKALLSQMGLSPSGAAASTTPVSTSSLMDLLVSLQKKMAGSTGDGASRLVLDDSAVRKGTTFEPVLPYTMADAGAQAAQANSVLAVRLHGKAGIDPASIFAPVAASTPGVSVEWRPVQDGNTKDVWVIVRPQDTWLLEDLVEVSAGAQTTTGEAVTADVRRFQVESQAQQDARLANPPQAIPQPKPDVDYDARGIDPAREASGGAVVTPVGQGQHPPSSPFQGGIAAAGQPGITDAGYSGYSSPSTGVPSVSVGVNAPVEIGPQRVYEPPQRVWLPVPAGVDAGAVRVYYYRSNGPDRGWYPAERVEGWMVPDSYLTVDVNGTTYLGFLVRHAGIAQLGIPK